MHIAMDALISRSDESTETELDDEIIVMAIETGKLYGMGDVAKDIWLAVEMPVKFGDLVDRLQQDYDVERQVCIDDLTTFLGHLEKSKLVRVTHCP
ncbi:MAG: PqqD family peptide modification chaperone [Pseudomonadota bacterium]